MSLTKEKAEEEIQQYFEQMKTLYEFLLTFIDNPDQIAEDDFTNLVDFITENDIERNKETFNHFIGLLVDISNNHHRHPGFFEKIDRIIQKYQISIKSNNSNYEIYEQFESNKRLLYFVIKEEILTIDFKIKETIKQKHEKNCIKYCYYFIPEIMKSDNEHINNKEDDEIIKYYLNHLEEYETARLTGENDSYICSLIREDSIEDFIIYVNRKNISLSSKIKPSIFETNSYLNENEPTLIEYAAFNGSIQIFQFLYMSNADVRNTIFEYAIHSNNADFLQNYIINKSIKPDDKTYEELLKECIKCHHNDFSRYIEDNYIDIDKEKRQTLRLFEERVYDCILKYHNYSILSTTYEDYKFFYLCKYNYYNVVKLLIESRKDIIEMRVILNLFYMEFIL